ncbi:DUF6602 domain-containing protein [Kitasatospora sp. NPDC006697]|uniref:DUF6602 domain-containing protein n=1 Tax=Kitasatospora sp. NPDC006697 TaxID=3364020 RepID=UPI0036B2C21A
MTQETLGRILGSVAKRMHADFEQSQNFKHNGEKGTSRETLVRDFLAGYLPSHVEAIHNAEIIAATGSVSPQCDIVIVDRGAPPFTMLEGYRIIPNECLYGVIEVKSSLDSAALVDACEKIAKVRKLRKTAYRPVPGLIPRTAQAYGRTYDHFPTSGIVFAFGGNQLETLGTRLMEWCRGRDPEEWPDSVWVLGKGHLQWWDPRARRLLRSPTAGATLMQVDALPGHDILLPLVLHLNLHFSDAWMDPLDLFPYSAATSLGALQNQWSF